MPATEVSPSACRLCGEIHRSMAAHLRRAHGLDVDSRGAGAYVLHEDQVPPVWVESRWVHERSTAESTDDLCVSILTNADIVFSQKVNRPLFESRRTGNIKRTFPFRTDLQYVWYDDIGRLPMFYALSKLKYDFANVQIPKRTQLLPTEGVDLGVAARDDLLDAFDRVVLRPRRIRVPRKSIREISDPHYMAFPYSQFSVAFSVVPTALVRVQRILIYLLSVEEHLLEELDGSRLIARARKVLAPYPLILTARNSFCLNGASVRFDGHNELRDGLLGLSEDSWRRRLSVPTIAA